MEFFERSKTKKAEFREKMAEDIKTKLIREAAPALFTLAHEVVEGGGRSTTLF